MEESNLKICSIATGYGTLYFTYDTEHNEAMLSDGRKVMITEEKLASFMHTAKMLGFDVGKDGKAL